MVLFSFNNYFTTVPKMKEGWQAMNSNIFQDLRVDIYVDEAMHSSSFYMGAIRVNGCFQYLAQNNQVDIGAFTMKEFVSKGAFVCDLLGIPSPLQIESSNIDMAQTLSLMDSFRIFDRSNSGKVTIDDFVNGILEHLIQLRKNDETISEIAQSLYTDALSISQRNHGVGSNPITDEMLHLHVDSLLSIFVEAAEKLHSISLFSHFIAARLEIIRDQSDGTGISVVIISRIIVSSIEDSMLAIRQYFHISNFRWDSLRHLNGDSINITNTIDNQNTLDGSLLELGLKSKSDCVWNLNAPQMHLYCAAKDTSDGLTVETKLVTNIPNEAPAMDKGELLLLQTAFKSVETFLLLSSDKNTNYSSPVRFSFSEATEEEISPLNKRSKQILSSNPGVDSDLISQLLSAQDLLQKTATKMEVLEIVLDSQKMSLTSNSLHPRSQFGLVDSTGSNKPSSANEGAARNSESDISINADSDTTDGIFSAIKSEIDMLSLCVSERALKSHPLGYFLDNANKKVALITSESDDADLSKDGSFKNSQSTIKQPKTALDIIESISIINQNDDMVARSIYPMLERLQKLASSTMENVTSFHQAQQQMLYLSSTVKQQEERIHELKTAFELIEVERNESICMRVELQMLRESSAKLRSDQERLSHLQNDFDRLDRHSRQLSEQLAEMSKQKKASLAKETDQMSTSSHNSSNSGSSKKANSSSEFRDAIHQLEVKIEALKGDNVKFEKENQRLKNSMQVAEQRVKSSLYDQMLLHHQIQNMEEELLTAKASITRLTREVEDRKFTRHNREEKDKRAAEMQREIAKLQHEVAVHKETLVTTAKLQSDLTIAEKSIETLENKLGDMSIEVERGAVASSQLDNYREQIRLKTKENRDLQVHIQGLTSQLKNVPYLQTKLTEFSDELQDYKVRVEKIPGLLAEIARMRGSSRASVKALNDQDKTVATFKLRVKQLEKENSALKNDNRSLQELEGKLKDALIEIKRLKVIEDEVNSLKTVVQNTNVEKKALEGENKKMRKFMRQSVISPGGIHINALTAGSGNNNNNNNNTNSSSAMLDVGPEAAAESAASTTPFLSLPSFEDDN